MDAVARLLATVPDDDGDADGHHQDIKGFVFVSLYAAYERLLKQSFRIYLEAATASAAGSLAEVEFNLRSIALEPLLKSIRDRKATGLWWQSAAAEVDELLRQPCDSIDPSFFPSDGSFFGESQVLVVWRSMGIDGHPAPVLGPAWGELEQIRRNRNRIAHGEIAADAVGSRYSISQLRTIVDNWRAGWLAFLGSCDSVVVALQPPAEVVAATTRLATADPRHGIVARLFRRRDRANHDLR